MESPLGYAWFLEQERVRALRPYHTSFLGSGRRALERDGHVVEVFPPDYHRGDAPLDHLLFALKYDGLALDVLHQVLPGVRAELTRALRDKPTSKALRQLWFFYEWLHGARLELPDAPRLAYEPAADPARYYTLPGERSPRHKVLNNLLGGPACSPIVRRSARLRDFDAKPLAERARDNTAQVDPGLLARVVRFLITKETKTTFALEREEIRGQREERFAAMLARLHLYRHIGRQELVEIQNLIVDQVFCEPDYREKQVFIGATVGGAERVHYIAPAPGDLPEMMAGLEALAGQVIAPSCPIPPVIAAALVAFEFLYIHPFVDGNGRLHRLLLQHVLARREFSPSGVVLPVSAAMLKDEHYYKNELLPAVDHALMPLLRWDIDDETQALHVRGNDRHLYAYLDLTAHAEALYRWVEVTIEVDILREVDFLKAHDRAVRAMRRVIDLPDRLESLFIQLCRDNGFRLSQTKRRAFFDMLSDEEIARLEAAVEAAFLPQEPPAPP